jgi:hypothetical protein
MVTLNCEHCKNPFETTKAKARGCKSVKPRRFCSHKCFWDHNKGTVHNSYQHNAKQFECKQCGKKVRKTKNNKHVFCSTECWRAYQTIYPVNGFTKCLNCGKTFKRLKPEHYFCTRSCRDKHKIGEKSHCWKGGRAKHGDGRIALYTKERYKDGKSKGEIRYRLEHRVAVEEYIGRPLEHQEKVWHIDCDKGNNSLQNLFVFRSQGDMNKAIHKGLLPLESNLDRMRDDEQYIQTINDCQPIPLDHPVRSMRLFQCITAVRPHNNKCCACGKTFYRTARKERKLPKKTYCSRECFQNRKGIK